MLQVCALEDMDSIQQVMQALSLGPGFLCETAMPILQAFHIMTRSLAQDSSDLFEALFETFIGDPNTYNVNINWYGDIGHVDLKINEELNGILCKWKLSLTNVHVCVCVMCLCMFVTQDLCTHPDAWPEHQQPEIPQHQHDLSRYTNYFSTFIY